MTNIELLEENEGRRSHGRTFYPRLRLLQGGKGPPEPPGEDVNWLADFDVGTTFTCRDKRSQEVELNLYSVLFKDRDVIVLAWKLPDGKVLDYPVDPVRFSKKNEHVTILGLTPVAREENDERNSLRPPDLVLHEAVQGVDQVVSETEQPDLPDGDRG